MVTAEHISMEYDLNRGKVRSLKERLLTKVAAGERGNAGHHRQQWRRKVYAAKDCLWHYEADRGEDRCFWQDFADDRAGDRL